MSEEDPPYSLPDTSRGGAPVSQSDVPSERLAKLTAKLDDAVAALTEAPTFAKPGKVRRVLDAGRRVLLQDGGGQALQRRAPALEESGVFWGSDWAHPETLDPALSPSALKSPHADTVAIEALSDVRLVAIAMGDLDHPQVSAEDARQHLTQVLALNLVLLFGTGGESERGRGDRLVRVARATLAHIAECIGYEQVLGELVDEIWRILQQRPVQVAEVKQMITQMAVYRERPDVDLGGGAHGADRLISSLYGPTQACREDPGTEIYLERLQSMDSAALQAEASGLARAMHDTGLVSPYHAVLLRLVRDHGDRLVAEALGLSSTGRDCLLSFRELVHDLIGEAIHPQTAQAVYGLALLLDRGILYQPQLPPALWRQLRLPVSAPARERLTLAFGPDPSPGARLLAGVLSMLGLPLGIGQGNNPTCQAARALSMWAYNDPDYLLQMVVWAARDGEIIMHFEGAPISSADSLVGVASSAPVDLDPVSLLVVPHLDRIYAEMGRRCVAREGDPHRWVNPEFHGWWAGRGFHINVDVRTGKLIQLEQFIRDFYAVYHPFYNGNQPLIYPQPAGLAATDSSGRFVGWHAITILRASLDPEGVMRAYFFNPNNDGGQDWGDEVVVSTWGHGERFGESSLPFEQFASRLYIFHTDPLEEGEPAMLTDEELATVVGYVHRSWGADRLAAEDLPGDADLGLLSEA